MPKTTMKVLVVGFPKTGTATLKAALTELGYKVYHFEEHFYYAGKQWIKIFTTGGSKEDFYDMYEDVDAACDMPACVFWEEILEAFPDVKLIFTKRKTEEDWLKSWNRQVEAINGNFLVKLLTIFSPTFWSFSTYCEHIKRIVFCGAPRKHPFVTYDGISPTVAKKRYRDHNTGVFTRAPKAQLLIYELTEGWEPLCKFLGHPEIPKKPFPHKNVKGSMVEEQLRVSPMFAKMIAEAKFMAAVFVILLGILVYCIFSLL